MYNNYHVYSIVSAKDRELDRLRQLLTEHGIDWAVELGHSTYTVFMLSEFVTMYKSSVGYKARVTMHYPLDRDGKRIRLGYVNAYGWRVVAIYEIFKLNI